MDFFFFDDLLISCCRGKIIWSLIFQCEFICIKSNFKEIVLYLLHSVLQLYYTYYLLKSVQNHLRLNNHLLLRIMWRKWNYATLKKQCITYMAIQKTHFTKENFEDIEVFHRNFFNRYAQIWHYRRICWHLLKTSLRKT